MRTTITLATMALLTTASCKKSKTESQLASTASQNLVSYSSLLQDIGLVRCESTKANQITYLVDATIDLKSNLSYVANVKIDISPIIEIYHEPVELAALKQVLVTQSDTGLNLDIIPAGQAWTRESGPYLSIRTKRLPNPEDHSFAAFKDLVGELKGYESKFPGVDFRSLACSAKRVGGFGIWRGTADPYLRTHLPIQPRPDYPSISLFYRGGKASETPSSSATGAETVCHVRAAGSKIGKISKPTRIDAISVHRGLGSEGALGFIGTFRISGNYGTMTFRCEKFSGTRLTWYDVLGAFNSQTQGVTLELHEGP